MGVFAKGEEALRAVEGIVGKRAQLLRGHAAEVLALGGKDLGAGHAPCVQQAQVRLLQNTKRGKREKGKGKKKRKERKKKRKGKERK